MPIKIRFVSNFDTSKNINQRVISNYVTDENYDPNIVFTDDDDYGFLFIINKLTINTALPKEQIFTFIMEPSWSPNFDKNCFNYSNKVFYHEKKLFGNNENIIECPCFMFYHMDYKKHSINDLFNNYDFSKKHKMSMIVSYGSSSPYNPTNIYQLRTNLALNLINNDFDVDIYGRGWNSSNKHIRGPISDKYDALIDYQYSIGVENSSEKNYLTEKFFDIPLCNAMPIYYGAPNVNDIYKNYISIDLNNTQECLDIISDVLRIDEYNPEKIMENKLSYYKNYNMYDMVKKLIYGYY